MCAALRDELLEVQPVLEAADAGVAQSRREVDRLKRVIRKGHGTPENLAALAAAESALRAALAQRDQCLDAYHTSACSVLTEGQRTALGNIRGNRGRKAPMAYLVVNRTAEEWETLEEYLDIERIETHRGHPIPASVVSTLANARSNSQYAAAQAAFDADLAGLKATVNVAIRD